MQEFFSFNFPLREFFFSYLAPPPPDEFSNGPSLRTLISVVSMSAVYGNQYSCTFQQLFALNTDSHSCNIVTIETDMDRKKLR